MSDLLRGLEAKLQKEVDEAVARVRLAADEAVEAFRKMAEATARGEIAARAPTEPVQGPVIAPAVTHQTPDDSVLALPPGVLEEVGEMFGHIQFNEAIAADNMRI